MKKIISLFQRNYDGDKLVRDEVTPGAEWVQRSEGVATRKWDGSACLWKDGVLWKRYDAKRGKVPPAGFVPAQEEPDSIGGHWPGWVPCSRADRADRWHFEALDSIERSSLFDGATYELVGPKVNGNPENFIAHLLLQHGDDLLLGAPTSFEELKKYFREMPIEGIVWWHSDGRMVKIKARDFGLKRL